MLQLTNKGQRRLSKKSLTKSQLLKWKGKLKNLNIGRNQTYLINVSRGEVQVEEDIIEAINNGKLSGAFLDVFEEEPLPKDSPLWSHPKVKITPHIASLSYSDEGVRQVMENYERLNKNKTLLNLVDRKKMY